MSIYALSASASSEDLSPRGITCKTPAFTKKEIINIVKKAREANPKLIAETENADINIHRQRCHYVYRETPRANTTVDLSRYVTINEVGEIASFIVGRSGKSGFKCPDVKYSVEQMAKFLQLSRARFSDLPKQPNDFTARVNKVRCMYVYYEYPLSIKEGKGYSFTFDYNGDLYSFRPLIVQIRKYMKNK